MSLKIYEKKIKLVEYNNKKCYAINNFDNEEINEYSEFSIGSITKLFTIISLLLLHQNKLIEINDYIGKYINRKELDKVKIIDIMNHKSGLKNWYNSPYGTSDKKYTSAIEVYNDFKSEKLLTEKPDMFLYSNIGFNLLGVLIETVSKMTWAKFVEKNIIKPLNMNNTGITNTNITLYDSKNKKLTKNQKWERTKASSSGQLKCCIHDFFKFSKFPKLLDESSLNLLQTLYIFQKIDNKYYIQHNGAISGSYSELSMTFNIKWKMIDMYIKLETGKN